MKNSKLNPVLLSLLLAVSIFATACSNWPESIPAAIPALESGTIDKVEDLTSQSLVEFQPEKIMFMLEVSNLTDQQVKNYFENLKNDSWKTSVSSLMDGNLSYRAEKNDYVVTIEENTKGANTAYFYVYLSEKATNALVNP